MATASMKASSPLWTVLLLLLVHSLLSFQARAHEGHDHDTHPGAPSSPSSPASTSMASAPIKALSPLWAVLLLLPFLSFQARTKSCHGNVDTNFDADVANCGDDDDKGTSAPNPPSPCNKSSVFWAPMKASRPLWKTLLLLLLFLVLSTSLVNPHGGLDHDAHANGDEQDKLRSRGLIAVKIWCLVILLVSTFAGGISPYFYRWNESFLLMGTQFAGGIVLGTSLVHFLADANTTFSDLTSNTYPFAFMLASVGYLLTMFGDCVIVWVTQGGRKEARVEAEGAGKRGEEHGQEMSLDLHPAFLRTTSLGDTSLLLILALCFHSVFEGIAVGVAGRLVITFHAI